MEGELEIDEPIEIKLSDDLTSAQKIEKIYDWVLENFEAYGLHSHDFSQWDNDFDLDLELENEGFKIEDILDEFFEYDISPNERKKIIEKINDSSFGDENWVPQTFRVGVNPIDEPIPDYDELISKIPSILKDLEYIKKALPQLIGDNGAPGTELLNAEYISDLQADLQEVENTPKEVILEKKNFFSSLVKRAQKFVLQFSQVFSDKTKIYRDAFLQSAAKEVGKSATEELLKYIHANNRISNWFEALGKFLGDWFS